MDFGTFAFGFFVFSVFFGAFVLVVAEYKMYAVFNTRSFSKKCRITHTS